MSKNRGRRNASNAPEQQPLTLIAVGHNTAIFQCSRCGEVHIHHHDGALVDAVQHENEESRPQLTDGSHDHSLGQATESSNDQRI
jgi:hypothetical protein